MDQSGMEAGLCDGTGFVHGGVNFIQALHTSRVMSKRGFHYNLYYHNFVTLL